MKGEPVQTFTLAKACIVPPNHPALECNMDRCSFYDHRLMIVNKSGLKRIKEGILHQLTYGFSHAMNYYPVLYKHFG